jgi:hypothetical protein
MINAQGWQLIADFKKNGVDIAVYRDVSGKWYVKCDGITTQHTLNCVEIVRYLCNAANEQ